MTFKKKSMVPLNTISSTSGEFCQNKFANGNNSYNNPARNNRSRFPISNRSYNKRSYTNVSYNKLFYFILLLYFFVYLIIFLLQVGFRRPTHANNNLIAIIPTENEGDSQPNNTTTKNFPENVNSKLVHIPGNTKAIDIQNFSDEGKY